MKKVIRVLIPVLLIVCVVLGFRLQKKVKVKMYNDDKAVVMVPDEYELADTEKVLLNSYPALLTFKHGRYTIDVVEAFDFQITSLINNPNLVIAQSDVVNSTLSMSNQPESEALNQAYANAKDFHDEYANIYPTPEFSEVGNGYHRSVPYTDFSYFDPRLNPMFQGVITDVIELDNSFLCVMIYDDKYDEDTGLNDCEFQDLITSHPKAYFSDMAVYINSMSDHVISTYNVCASRSEKLRARMERELEYFESKLCINPWWYHLIGTKYEQDGKAILTANLNAESSDNMKYYTDPIEQKSEVETEE